MVVDWLLQAPAIAVAAAVLFGPGLAIGAGLRLRGLALWALAPVASTAAVAGAAIVLALIGVPWTAVSALLALAVLVVLAWAAGQALGRPRRSPRSPGGMRWMLPLGLIIGAVLGALRFGFLVGDPAAISQSNDAVFHLNALRFILETGSASSLDVSAVIGASGFYPAAWHGLASLVVLLSGASIPVAANAVALILVAGVWPVGTAWYTHVISRGSIAPTAFAAALSPSLLTFPLLMLQWGVLYPYALSIALVPAVAASAIVVPQWFAGFGPFEGRRRTGVLAALVFAAGLAAIALSQPATLLAVGVIAAIWFTWWVVRHVGSADRVGRRLLVSALVASWLVLAAAWAFLTRSTSGSQWPAFRSVPRALIDVLLNSQVMLPLAVGTSILMIVGLVVAVRRPRLRWLATTWLVFALMYLVSATVDQQTVRRLLLGAWYADPYRLAALAPIVVIPLAALGLASIVAWAASALSREPRSRRPVAWALAAVAGIGVVALAVAPVVHLPDVVSRERETASRYASDAESFLSPDERALAERLGESVPDDALIIGNPSAGTGFAYLFSGLNVYPRTWAPPTSLPWRVIEADLRDIASTPEVCAALDQIGGARYVLDFGPGDTSPGRYLVPGMTGFAGRDGFELVDEQGDASLWRITACES